MTTYAGHTAIVTNAKWSRWRKNGNRSILWCC